MIHTATLVHDDVLDEAQMRRHLATVNARWDNEASVLLGDFLFTHAFYLASTLDSVVGCRLIGRATNIVCEGELRQKGSRGNFDLTEAEYLRNHRSQNGGADRRELPAGGAVRWRRTSDGRSEWTASAAIWASRFKLPTTCSTCWAKKQTTGKSLGTDLEKQKPTLPIIHALQMASPADRQALLERLTTGERCCESLVPNLDSCGAIEYARQRARQFASRARCSLDALPASPSRDVLSAMTEFVVSRSM